MSFSSPPTSPSFEHTVERLMAAETSVAAFTSIRGGSATDSSVSASMRKQLKKSQERASLFGEIVGDRNSAAKPNFDPRLNAVLDRAFGRFSGDAAVGSATRHVIKGIMELRSYQKTVLLEFRSTLSDPQDQERRNWASEEIVKIQCEIAQLNKLVSIPAQAQDFTYRMAS